jgi:hypothetical protein
MILLYQEQSSKAIPLTAETAVFSGRRSYVEQEREMAGTPEITFVRVKGMYGDADCNCIRVMVDGEQVDDARRIGGVPGRGLVWYLGAYDTESELDWDRRISIEQNWEKVEAELRKHVDAHFAKAAMPLRVQARQLVAGDVVGSGETIVQVAAGVRTPRGKVEVTLEKDGRRRLTFWGASTVINIRRAA